MKYEEGFGLSLSLSHVSMIMHAMYSVWSRFDLEEYEEFYDFSSSYPDDYVSDEEEEGPKNLSHIQQQGHAIEEEEEEEDDTVWEDVEDWKETKNPHIKIGSRGTLHRFYSFLDPSMAV